MKTTALFRMSKSSLVIFCTIGFGFLIYFLSPGPSHLIDNLVSWELREQLVFLTGTCTICLMVVSMILSARIPSVSRWMNGLDKGYVVHKWTGIFSTLFVLCHFLMEKVPHWLVEAGVIPNPGELTDASEYPEIQINLFQSGTLIAQPVFYGMMLLVAIALIKKIPYHWFRKTHTFFPIVFLLGAWHAGTAQLKERWLGTPASFLLFAVLLIGIVAAIIALTKNIGASRKIKTTIADIIHHANNIIDISLDIENKNFNYQPGQYAFLKFSHHDEPHPFSIASLDKHGKKLRFAIKQLGDFTSQLPHHLQVGQIVQVEGPYGEFHFNDHCKRQVWIAGGIGITPFMSRLEHLTHTKSNKQIDFWYSTRGNNAESFPFTIEETCSTSEINFYHLDSTQKEYLTVDMIKSKMEDLSNTSIWFCGPAAFAECIKSGLKSSGFDMGNFHYDSFSMR